MIRNMTCKAILLSTTLLFTGTTIARPSSVIYTGNNPNNEQGAYDAAQTILQDPDCKKPDRHVGHGKYQVSVTTGHELSEDFGTTPQELRQFFSNAPVITPDTVVYLVTCRVDNPRQMEVFYLRANDIGQPGKIFRKK